MSDDFDGMNEAKRQSRNRKYERFVNKRIPELIKLGCEVNEGNDYKFEIKFNGKISTYYPKADKLFHNSKWFYNGYWFLITKILK